jgi:hypothetical protein
MPYRIKNEYTRFPALVTIIGGESVNLKGQDLKKVIPATKKAPERTQLIRAATQKDLETVYNAGDPCVEKYQDVVPEKPKETPVVKP